jgi:hypothetical protein
MLSKITFLIQLAIFIVTEGARGPLIWSDEFDTLNSINNNWNQEVIFSY